MEIGGFFILLIVLAVLGVLGGFVYVVGAWLRGRRLDPRGDRIAAHDDPDAGRPEPRPEHTRVEADGDARYVGSR